MCENINELKSIITNCDDMVLRLETTNNCNFNCSFCTHGQMKRQKGFMKRDLYQKVIKEATDLGIHMMEIRSFGEPLLDDNFEEEIVYANSMGMDYIGFTTNGFLLTKERYLSLSKTPLNRISFSLSPKKEYEITRGVNFDILMHNLSSIQPYSHKIPIIVHLIASNLSTKKQCIQLEYKLTRMGYKWVKDPIHNWAEGLAGCNKNTVPCLRLWNTITVNWDGIVPICCLDYDAREVIGDVNVSKLSEVINSNKYQNLRYLHLHSNYPDICQKCNYLLFNNQ